jgi:hypothetical protein
MCLLVNINANEHIESCSSMSTHTLPKPSSYKIVLRKTVFIHSIQK